MKLPFVIACLFCASIVHSENWATWRGSNGDSSTSETISINTDFSKQLWSKEIGEGYAGISVHENYLLTAGKIDSIETLFCLDCTTGKTIWSVNYPTVEVKRYPGSRSTPVTDGDSVYMITRLGKLMALDLKTGKEQWSVDVTNKQKEMVPHWGFSSSIIIKNNHLILNIGDQGWMVNKKTGKAVWANAIGKSSHSSPVTFSYKNSDFVAIFTSKGLTVVDEKAGKVACSFPWKSKRGQNSTDPIVSKDGSKILVSDNTAKPSIALLKFDGKSLTPIWQNSNLKSHFSTPVVFEDTIYGANGRTGAAKLVAIDFNTGKLLWSSKEKFGSPILAGKELLYLDERGQLILIKPNREKLEILKKARVLTKGKCWTLPTLANGRIYVRNDRGNLICIDTKGNK